MKSNEESSGGRRSNVVGAVRLAAIALCVLGCHPGFIDAASSPSAAGATEIGPLGVDAEESPSALRARMDEYVAKVRDEIDLLSSQHRRDQEEGVGIAADGTECDCAKAALLELLKAGGDALEAVPLTFLGLLEGNKDYIWPPGGWDPTNDFKHAIEAIHHLSECTGRVLRSFDCGSCDVYDGAGSRYYSTDGEEEGRGGGGGWEEHGTPYPNVTHHECCCDAEYIKDLVIAGMKKISTAVNLSPGASDFTRVFLDAVKASTKSAVLEMAQPYCPHRESLATNCLEPGIIYSYSVTGTDTGTFMKLDVGQLSGDSEVLFHVDTDEILDVSVTPSGTFFATDRPESQLNQVMFCDGTMVNTGVTMPFQTNGMWGGDMGEDSSTVLVQGYPLVEVDENTLEVTNRSDGDEVWCSRSSGDMVWHPEDNIIYSTLYDCGECNGGDTLITIDPDTAVQTSTVGCITECGRNVPFVFGMAIDKYGRVLVGTYDESDLFVLDTTDATLTRIPISGPYGGTQGLASIPCFIC